MVGYRAVKKQQNPQHHAVSLHSQNFKVTQNLKNKHRDHIINRVHAPTKVNGFTKYEQNPLNIVGCRVVTRAGPKHQSVSVFIKFESATGT